jgi:hypothetical protein
MIAAFGGGADVDAGTVVERARARGWVGGECYGLYARALFAAQDDPEGARAIFETARQRALLAGNLEAAGLPVVQLVWLELRLRPLAEAARAAERALHYWAELGNVVNLLSALLPTAVILRRAGDIRTASLVAGQVEERKGSLLPGERALFDETLTALELANDEGEPAIERGRALPVHELAEAALAGLAAIT